MTPQIEEVVVNSDSVEKRISAEISASIPAHLGFEAPHTTDSARVSSHPASATPGGLDLPFVKVRDFTNMNADGIM